MNDQLALVGPATPPCLKLTPRQRFALEFISRRPVSSEELGAALHEWTMREGKGRGHIAQMRCDFCQTTGAEMGNRLRREGLMRFARNLGVWYLVEQGRPADAPKAIRSAQAEVIPF